MLEAIDVKEVNSIAFIGTGIMGAPMAEHLIDAGFDVVVHNRSKAKAQPLIDKGAQWADTPKEAFEQTDCAITMLGFPQDVEEVYLGDNGLLAALESKKLLIDMSTSSPELAQEIYQSAAIEGCLAIDAPVTGSQDQAKQGVLTIMVGVDQKTLDKISYIFEPMGTTIVPCGEPGDGQLTKLANQIALAGAMVAMCEALSFAKQNGLNLERTRQIIASGSAGSTVLERLGPKILSGDFMPAFTVKHLIKDLDLALEQAHNLELTLPGANTAADLYGLLSEVGGLEFGTQALSLVYEDKETSEAAGLDWSQLDEADDEDHDHDEHEH